MWVSSWLAAAFLTVLAVYGCTLLVASAAIAMRRRDASLLLWLPLVFATVHAGSGAGALIEGSFLTRRRDKEPAVCTKAAACRSEKHRSDPLV